MTWGSPRVEIPNADSYPSNAYYEPTLLVIHKDGTIWRSWKMMGANGNQPFNGNEISIGDFNQDNQTDIAVVYRTVSGGGTSGYLSEGVATVLTTGRAFVAANSDWPLPYRNTRNAALLRRDQTAPNVTISSPSGGAAFGTTMVSVAVNDNDEVSLIELYVDGTLRGTAATWKAK